MRSFDDEHGNHWQAALLDASFGNIWIVFSCLGASEVLKNTLDSANISQAEDLLANMDEASLMATLAGAVPWA